MEQNEHENMLAGSVGAFLGSLIGVACIVGIGQLGYVASLSGLVMAVCALKGYSLLGGTLSRKGAVIACVLTIIMTYFGNRLDFAVSVARVAEVDVFTAFRAMGDLLDAGYINLASYWGNLALLYLFTLLGAVPTLNSAFRHGRAGGVSPETADGTTQQGVDPEIPETAGGMYPQYSELGTPSTDKGTGRATIFTFFPFIGMFLGFAVIWFSISPLFVNWLVGDAQSPEALLQGYSHWYISIIGAVVVAVLLPVAGAVVSAKKGAHLRGAVVLMLICTVFPLFVGGAMIVMEDVPGLLSQAKEDMAQIESGQLQEVTVWLSPKSQAARLPGPYAEGQPEPVTRYRGIGDGLNTWVDFYVPNSLGFSLDPNALYNEGESINWNEENAQQYHLRFTEHFYLVVSAEPVETSGNTAVETAQPDWETQLYQDEYLSYEIPAAWLKNEENSNDEFRFTLFTEKDPAAEMPSNVSVQILSLQNQSKDFDYSDPEIQEQYHQFLISPDSGLVAEAQNGEYQVEQIAGTWVYSISFAREASDGTMVQQTGYFPMGLDYSLAVWATDYQDGCTPAVEEVATHICQTLSILGN